jgi:hypothetical protein
MLLLISLPMLFCVRSTFAETVKVGALTKGGEITAIEHQQPRALSMGLAIMSLYKQSNLVVVPVPDVEQLLREDSMADEFTPLRVGVVQSIPKRTAKDGIWTRLENGGWLWTISFDVSGARGVRLRISPWRINRGTEFIVYNAHDQSESYGPFTKGEPAPMEEFYTPTVFSEKVYLECYLRPGSDRSVLESTLAIDGIIYVYRTPFDDEEELLPCHKDVTCYPAWLTDAKGVAFIQGQWGGFYWQCSGALLNRVPGDETPLFQTALHCQYDDTHSSNIEVYWFYRTDVCPGGTAPPFATYRTHGVKILANHPDTDFQLIGLLDTVPAGVTFLSWDAGLWNTSSPDAVGIHHPLGSYKRIAFGTLTGTSKAGYRLCSDCYHVTYPVDNGTAQSGSSGSPVFDAAHAIRGVLSGGHEAACDHDTWKIYGRFDIAYSGLSPYLNPEDPVYVRGSHSGDEIGTELLPFNTVIEGVFAVIAGSNLHIETGSYDEELTIRKAMEILAEHGPVTIGE